MSPHVLAVTQPRARLCGRRLLLSLAVETVLALFIPVAALAAGVWCGIRIERHGRDRELDDLFDQ